MRHPKTIVAIAVLVTLALPGCASGDRSEFLPGVAEPAIGYDTYAESAPAPEGAGALEPDVITTGYLTLIVEEPGASADEITQIVSDQGGRIQSRSDYTPTDFAGPSSYLEARIPSDVLEPTLAAIKEVGVVQEVSVNTVDVSLQKIDLDARIAVLESAIARLVELLATAESTSDLVAIESALAERQAELDSLTSQRNYLSDQTLFATISISLQTPIDATPTDPDGFFDGLIRGWEGILAFFAGVVVWAGILVPWIGLGLVVIAAIIGVRALVRLAKR